MKKIALFILFTSMVSLRLAWAHGEDRPGPHGGYIRMPGAFHTEVIPMNKGFKVLLLDIQLRDPSVEESGVAGHLESKGERVPLVCAKHADHFFCEFPQGKPDTDGTLIFVASRKGGPVARASYRLPLRFGEPQEPNPHRHH